MNTLTLSNPEKMISDFHRQWIGADRMLDSVRRLSNVDQGFPPHNVIKTGDESYAIELAVAGFDRDDITVEMKDGALVIRGEKADDEKDYLHRGIATRTFTRSFYLGEYVEVSEVKMKDGMLILELVREIPEAMKPKTFEIK